MNCLTYCNELWSKIVNASAIHLDEQGMCLNVSSLKCFSSSIKWVLHTTKWAYLTSKLPIACWIPIRNCPEQTSIRRWASLTTKVQVILLRTLYYCWCRNIPNCKHVVASFPFPKVLVKLLRLHHLALFLNASKHLLHQNKVSIFLIPHLSQRVFPPSILVVEWNDLQATLQ